MSYQSILVHQDRQDDSAARLQIALGLAGAAGGAVEAVYCSHPVSLPTVGRALSLYLAEAEREAKRQAGELERRFLEACAAAGVSGRWRLSHEPPADILARRSFVADLAVVSRPAEEDLETRVAGTGPEDLPLAAGCPVLVLPPGYGALPPSAATLIAWKACREAANAVRAALPWLKRSPRTVLCSIGDPDDLRPAAEEFAERLARHGVRAEVRLERGDPDDAGDALLAAAAAETAGAVVLGAYGHPRLAEVVLGGTTRRLLTAATLPLLMAH